MDLEDLTVSNEMSWSKNNLYEFSKDKKVS